MKKKKKPQVTINSMVFGEDVPPLDLSDVMSDCVSMVGPWPVLSAQSLMASQVDEGEALRAMANEYAKWESLHRTIIWCVGMVVGAATLIQVLGMFVPRCASGG